MFCNLSHINDYYNDIDNIQLIFYIINVFNGSCGVPSPTLDSDNFLEAWLTCHLNDAYLAALFCQTKLLVDINLYELVNVFDVLHHAVSVEHIHASVLA
jgi:hypothetical protein